jgi:hypothetical protein
MAHHTTPRRSTWNTLYRTAQKNAARRSISFSLTPTQFHDLIARANGGCMVTGIPFEFAPVAGVSRRPFAPSLDRINNRQDDTADNVRLVYAG